MLSGRVMESGSRDDVIGHRAHPYTKKLISVIPRINRQVPRGVSTRLPDRRTLGCPYADGCEMCREQCRNKVPPLKEISQGHFVRGWCILGEDTG